MEWSDKGTHPADTRRIKLGERSQTLPFYQGVGTLQIMAEEEVKKLVQGQILWTEGSKLHVDGKTENFQTRTTQRLILCDRRRTQDATSSVLHSALGTVDMGRNTDTESVVNERSDWAKRRLCGQAGNSIPNHTPNHRGDTMTESTSKHNKDGVFINH
jgi:hypothetical protein